MRKVIAVLIAATMIGLCVPSPAQAQERPKESGPGPAKATQPVHSYRLDFSFNEVLEGKNVNTRHYSMNMTTGESNEIKIGTRVPVPAFPGTNTTQFQYMDIGTNIWAQLREAGDESVLVVRSEVSNLDSNSGEHAGASVPLVRQIKISGDTLLVVGKPILIGSADDPNSKRQFQLEVTVTKLK